MITEERGIVLGLEERGENFWLLIFLAEEGGLLHPLLRKTRRSTRPDLFDTAHLSLRRKSPEQPAFVERYTVLRRRSAIGKDYSRIKVAAEYVGFLRKNVYHLEHFAPLLERSELFLNAMEEGVALQAALFKAIYLFVKDEGHPVKEDWWANLSAGDKQQVQNILLHPLSQQTTSNSEVAELMQNLKQWLRGHAHFL